MPSFTELQRNTTEEKRDIWLYRTFGIERLFQLLTEKKLTLLEPSKWEDPYEKALQELATGSKPSSRPSLYGLCWSTQGRSDALWRIYSPNKLGVRISTTVETLRFALAPNEWKGINPDTLFLGRVSYLPEQSTRNRLFDFGKYSLGLTANDFNRPIRNIADAIEDMIQTASPSPENVAKALYVKRTAFEHEKEVRLLYVDTNTSAREAAEKSGLLKLDVDPLALIRGIQFDPRLSDDIYQALRASIEAILGSNSIKISKSTLYKGPNEIVAERKK